MIQGKSKIPYSDLTNMSVSDLNAKYKLKPGQLDIEARKHMYGITPDNWKKEAKPFFDKVFKK